MHCARIVADEEDATLQALVNGEEVDTHEIDDAVGWKRREEGIGAPAARKRAEHGDAASWKRPGRAGQPPRQLGEARGRPFLSRPVRDRPQRQHGRARRDQALGRGDMLGLRPQAGKDPLVETDDVRVLLHHVPVTVPRQAGPAVPCGEEVTDRRAAQINDGVPEVAHGGGPQPQPMSGPFALGHGDDAREIRHRFEQRRGVGAAGDGDARLRMLLDEMRQHAARQDGIADPTVRDKENSHASMHSVAVSSHLFYSPVILPAVKLCGF